MTRFRLFAAFAFVSLLSGCDDASHGETYAIPADQVRQTLLGTDAPIQVLGRQAVDWKARQQGDDTVQWTVLGDNDRQLLRFAARIVPVEGGTRVDVEVLPPEGAMKETVAKGLADHAAIRDLYHTAMTEEIDAKLEHRGFDATRIAAATVRAAAANVGSISDSMDRAGEEFRRQDAEDEASAKQAATKAAFGDYGKDGSGPRTFGAPMDNPNIH